MNVVAVRDDGALLVLNDSGDAATAAIVLNGQVYRTTRESALARGYWSDPTNDAVITPAIRKILLDTFTPTEVVAAAAKGHTGAMVALVPSEEDAERLAIDGGEDADELHVTLVYLGEAALIPPEVRADLIDSASRWAETFPTIIGNAFAVDLFNPTDLTAGAEPCVVLGIGGDLVANAHEVVLQSANAILAGYGIPLVPQHRPWVAHLTLLYTDDADPRYFTDRIGPVTFDRLRVAFGDDVYDIPLGDYEDDDEVYEPGEDDTESEATMMDQDDRREVEK